MLSDCFKTFPRGSLGCSHPEAGRWRGPETKGSYSHSTELAKVKAECLFPSGFASNKWLHPKSWFLWMAGVWKNVLLFLLVVCCSSPIPGSAESPRYVVDELAKARLYSRNASSSAWALPRRSRLPTQPPYLFAAWNPHLNPPIKHFLCFKFLALSIAASNSFSCVYFSLHS